MEYSIALRRQAEPPASSFCNDISKEKPSPVGGIAKRGFDLIASAVLLTLFAPLFFLIAASVKMSSPGPVLYGHKRIGLNGETFRCLKFRTMVANGDEVLMRHLESHPEAELEWHTTRKLKADPRVTRFGRVLRDYSVDELPQLLNVFVGEMSLVGPRPIVSEELERYGPTARAYLAARPGITGLWQVSGRSETSFARRIVLDRAYVTRWRFWKDMYILLRTIPVVLGSKGAY